MEREEAIELIKQINLKALIDLSIEDNEYGN